MRSKVLLVLALAILLPATVLSTAQAQDPQTERVTIFANGPDKGTVNIPVGWSVEWLNGDSQAHIITLDLGGGDFFEIGEIFPGESVTVAFDDAGTYEWFVEGSPLIAGEVVVGGSPTQAATPTPTAAAATSTATATPRPPTATPTPRPSTATPTPRPSTPTPMASPTATQPAVGAVTSTTTPQPTPPAPSAGNAPMDAFRSTGVNGALALLATGAMVLALSSLMFSTVRGHLTIERRRDRRD